MMPNIDPRQMKRMMESLGIKSTEIKAGRVVIEGMDRNIVIENPQVTQIDAQGNRSFQISGDIKEVEKAKVEIDDDDVRMVMETSGVDDRDRALAALQESNGDIAAAIMKLKENAQ